MRARTFFLVCAFLSSLACGPQKAADNAPALAIDFAWTEKSRCASVSPPITVRNVPQETRYLKITMSDLDFPLYDHGGGEVAYEGSALIPEGALQAYAGPCPPDAPHSYEFTVQALGADKKQVLAQARATRKFPEKK